MQIHLSQAELCQAVALYLSEKVLQQHVEVSKVEPSESQTGLNLVLRVTVYTEDYPPELPKVA